MPQVDAATGLSKFSGNVVFIAKIIWRPKTTVDSKLPFGKLLVCNAQRALYSGLDVSQSLCITDPEQNWVSKVVYLQNRNATLCSVTQYCRVDLSMQKQSTFACLQ